MVTVEIISLWSHTLHIKLQSSLYGGKVAWQKYYGKIKHLEVIIVLCSTSQQHRSNYPNISFTVSKQDTVTDIAAWNMHKTIVYMYIYITCNQEYERKCKKHTGARGGRKTSSREGTAWICNKPTVRHNFSPELISILANMTAL